jgi:uncharacterized RDD family membrane protein YckC
MSEPAQAPFVQPQVRCPLCNRDISKRRKARKLYDYPVCKKCRNGFANRRQAAYIVDGLCWALAIWLPFWLLEVTGVAPQAPGANPIAAFFGFDTALSILVAWILPFFFYCKDGFNGMSPGKWLMGVQVVDARTHEPITFKQSFKRNLVMLIPYVELPIAFLLVRGRRWGDRWAKTRVVWRKYAYRPPFDTRGILCMECGYNLTGNVTGRCPECFTPTGAPPKARPINPERAGAEQPTPESAAASG